MARQPNQHTAPAFEKDQIWKGKGSNNPYVVKVLSAHGRIHMERIKGGPVGKTFRATREQVRMAYELVEDEG